MADLAPVDIVVLGCGNTNRSDDGAGPQVIAQLRTSGLPKTIRLFDVGTDGMSVIYRARGATHLIIIDACVPTGTPGAIFKVPGEVLESAPKQSLGLHDFRWNHALFAGRKIYGEAFPQDVSVFLIEAASLDLGLSLGPEVGAAVELVAQQVQKQIDVWLAG